MNIPVDELRRPSWQSFPGARRSPCIARSASAATWRPASCCKQVSRPPTSAAGTRLISSSVHRRQAAYHVLACGINLENPRSRPRGNLNQVDPGQGCGLNSDGDLGRQSGKVGRPCHNLVRSQELPGSRLPSGSSASSTRGRSLARRSAPCRDAAVHGRVDRLAHLKGTLLPVKHVAPVSPPGLASGGWSPQRWHECSNWVADARGAWARFLGEDCECRSGQRCLSLPCFRTKAHNVC